MSLPNGPVDLSLLQAALLLPRSWSGLRIFPAAWLVSSPREGPSESGEFQGLPEAISSCLPSGLKASLKNGIFQSQGNYDTTVGYYTTG